MPAMEEGTVVMEQVEWRTMNSNNFNFNSSSSNSLVKKGL
jgi:hypothetical protein